MNTAPAPITLERFLFSVDDPQELRSRLEQDGSVGAIVQAISALSAGLQLAAFDQLVEAVRGLLGTDLEQILMRGWAKHQALSQAATRTVNDPGSREVVELAEHRITWTQRPVVEIFVDSVSVATIHFTMEADLDVHAVDAVVVNGRLTEVASGKADATASLLCETAKLKSATRTLDLHLSLALPDGIDLLREPA